MRNLLEASVYIRCERVFEDGRAPTSGTGFFVHEAGYILTNRHVVADQVEDRFGGSGHKLNAKVLRLTAVLGSGTAEEREIAARVVARDTKNDLALLKIEETPNAIVDISRVADVTFGDRVWVVGFPFGDLLASERAVRGPGAPNPEPTLSRGIVTSLRRDRDGRVARLQIDASLNAGNAGGALIDSSGRLVGVVDAALPGGSGLGFAVAPSRVRRFLQRQAATVEFDPGVVLAPPFEIRVHVEPLLADIVAVGGTVRFEGDDIKAVEADLMPTGTGFDALIEVPATIQGVERPARYHAMVALPTNLSEKRVTRRYSLDAVPLSMLAERQLIPEPTAAAPVEDEPAVQGPSPTPTPPERTVPDEEDLVEVLAASDFDSARYRPVKNSKVVSLLLSYERLCRDLKKLRDDYRRLISVPDFRETDLSHEMGNNLKGMKRERSRRAVELDTWNVRFCRDEQIYFIATRDRSEDPCRGVRLRNP